MEAKTRKISDDENRSEVEGRDGGEDEPFDVERPSGTVSLRMVSEESVLVVVGELSWVGRFALGKERKVRKDERGVSWERRFENSKFDHLLQRGRCYGM